MNCEDAWDEGYEDARARRDSKYTSKTLPSCFKEISADGRPLKGKEAELAEAYIDGYMRGESDSHD